MNAASLLFGVNVSVDAPFPGGGASFVIIMGCVSPINAFCPEINLI